MLAKRRIRSQVYSGAAWLLLTVVFLSAASIIGSLKFRKLTKSFRGRAMETSLAADLNQSVSNLKTELYLKRQFQMATATASSFQSTVGPTISAEGKFNSSLDGVKTALADYRFQLKNAASDPYQIGDISRELRLLNECEKILSGIDSLILSVDWKFNPESGLLELERYVADLQRYTIRLPKFLKNRIDEFSDGARAEYYSWMLMTAVVTAGALLLLYVLYYQFRCKIIQPLEILVEGSRIVADGNYDHRVDLASDDEVAELAGALNAMTANFQEIKRELNDKVRQRTKEVVRSEKMASVGFLAAGVAHEINNPLSSIAWSAESLESRVHEILNPVGVLSQDARLRQIDEMQKYLQRIQEEAFRCKEITSALLDFSRLGDSQKLNANISEIVQAVIDIVRPLSKYRDRNIKFNGNASLRAQVNAQEIKQVVLNLITNALDSVPAGGSVEIELNHNGPNAVLSVRDDGCGMSDEVMQHLFEPFFTRRRDGNGTGLGLSITYQIIQEHGGNIVPHSSGPGTGSTFVVTLPITSTEHYSEEESRHVA